MSNDLKKQMLGSLRLSPAPRKPREKRFVAREKYRTPEIENGQAARIICRFGGARRLAAGLKAIGEPMSPSAIYRWLKPKEAWGTGGRVPTAKIPGILRAARVLGILLADEDITPRVIDSERMKTEYLADFNAFRMRAARERGASPLASHKTDVLSQTHEHKQEIRERDSGQSEFRETKRPALTGDERQGLERPLAGKLELTEREREEAMEALGFETSTREEPPTGTG